MIKYNPNNERIKREYYEFQKEAKRKTGSTIDNIRIAIDKYELFTDFDNFKAFNKQKAIAFKRKLAKTTVNKSGTLLSKSTLNSTLRHLKEFFKWLAYQKEYRRIDVTQTDYFNLTEKEAREARGKNLKRYPSIEQIQKVLSCLPSETAIEKRNQALIAFTILTGIRDGATASLKLKHIELNEELVEQKSSEVKTKFSKTIHTHFFPVGDEIKQIVIDWLKFLTEELLFNDDDPVFPRTKMSHNDSYELEPDGLEPIHWQSAGQIRKIFKGAFVNAGIEYFTPHSFRNTLVRLGEQICKTPEEFKAWSQSLGHEQVLTTFTSYGQIDEHRQGNILRSMSNRDNEKSTAELIKEIHQKLSK